MIALVHHFRRAYAATPTDEARRRLFDAESRAIAAGLDISRTV